MADSTPENIANRIVGAIRTGPEPRQGSFLQWDTRELQILATAVLWSSRDGELWRRHDGPDAPDHQPLRPWLADQIAELRRLVEQSRLDVLTSQASNAETLRQDLRGFTTEAAQKVVDALRDDRGIAREPLSETPAYVPAAEHEQLRVAYRVLQGRLDRVRGALGFLDGGIDG